MYCFFEKDGGLIGPELDFGEEGDRGDLGEMCYYYLGRGGI